MNDKEMLEFAAKAAGYGEDQIYPAPDGGLTLFEYYESTCGDGAIWNPLADDGDALRLAVKLGIAIDPRDYDVSGSCAVTEDGSLFVEDPRSQEPDVATRRAIVRAAEIGKQMK